jgi:tetratricopeptide (TPR) repeat protein
MLAAERTSYQADALQGWLEYDDQAWAESRKAFGRFRDDRHQMTESDTLSQIYYTMARGLIDQAEGKVGAAGNNLRQAESLVTAGPARLMTLTAWMPESRFGADELMVRRLQATALAAEGKLDQAIGVLTPVWPGPITVFFFREMILYYCPLAQDDLARLYVRKGDWDRAIAEYKVLTVIGPAHTNRRLVHPIYHYRLAQVYEKKGMAAEAIAEYERLATIWDKADPPRPEVAEARQRIAHLKSQVSAAAVGRVGS